VDMLGDRIDPQGNVLLQVLHTLPSKWIVSSDDLKQDCSKRPNIGFLIVEVADQDLRGHIEGRAAHSLMELPSATFFLGEAQVTEFELVAVNGEAELRLGRRHIQTWLELDEDVVEFDVSVNDMARRLQVLQTAHDIPDDVARLRLFQVLRRLALPTSQD